MKFEEVVSRHEQAAGKELSEELKVAVVLKALPPVIKNYVSVLTEEDIDYSKLREVLMKWERTQQKWSGQTSIAGGYDSSQATDMDISRIQNKGKGKNKGKESKGKGKFDSKGKSKGYTGYGSGGKSRYDNKGKGKGDNKGKGKGGKKGKSSDWNAGQKTSAVCYSCGKTGHMQKDCWSRTRDSSVKQVAGDAVSSAASTVPSSAAALNAQTTNKTIKRIFHLEGGFHDAFAEDFAYVNDVTEAHDEWCNAVLAEQTCGCLSCSNFTDDQMWCSGDVWHDRFSYLYASMDVHNNCKQEVCDRADIEMYEICSEGDFDLQEVKPIYEGYDLTLDDD